MKDVVPELATIPPGAMVPTEMQPEYLPLPDHPTAASRDLGWSLTDAHVVAGRGSDVALIHHEAGREITYAELSRETSRLANVMVGLGVRPGMRVAVRSPNRPEGVVAMIATWKAGGAVVPIPMQARRAELEFLLSDTTPHLFAAWFEPDVAGEVSDAATSAGVAQLVSLGGSSPAGMLAVRDALGSASDEAPKGQSFGGLPAVVWHTGGTTGRPKACYHTHQRFLAGGLSVGCATGIQRGERWATLAPVGHALGVISHTIFSLLHGATVVMIENYADAEVVGAAIGRHRVHTVTGIAASWARLAAAVDADPGLDVSSLRRGYSMWQSASSSEIPDRWAARGVPLRNNFGSTAFATWVLVPQGESDVAPSSLGAPAPGYVVRAIAQNGDQDEVAVGEVGRMAVRGPTGLTYWNRPDLQARDVVDGWSLQDDLVRFDADGNVDYLGRTDFLISTAGYKVAPGEVENVLASHPDVTEVAVVGAPDPIRREVVSAFVVLRPGVARDEHAVRELQAFAKRHLAPYKYPRIVTFLDELPRDSVGKVQQRRLRDAANELTTATTVTTATDGAS